MRGRDAAWLGSKEMDLSPFFQEIDLSPYLSALTDAGLERIGEASPGGAGRNRTLGLEKLMAIQVPIPPPATQRTFDVLQTKIAELKARHATLRQANDALIPATLERVFN